MANDMIIWAKSSQKYLDFNFFCESYFDYVGFNCSVELNDC